MRALNLKKNTANCERPRLEGGGISRLLNLCAFHQKPPARATELHISSRNNCLHMPKYHMRRKDKEVTDPEELVKPLLEAKFITLALCRDNKPYLATLSHGYDNKNNCIYFHSALEGKKIDYINSNPEVWGQALIDLGYQQGSCDHLFQTTQFNGTVSFIEDVDEKKHGLSVMIRNLEAEPDDIIKKQLLPSSIAKVHIGKIKIDHLSGKKADKIIISL